MDNYKTSHIMRQVEDTIQQIRKTLAEMWKLVQGQVERSSDALLNNNKSVAHEVRNFEKRVDTYELMIDRECENFFALLNPVAVDMRLIISVLKINNDLERIGDFANGIAKTVLAGHRDQLPDELLDKLALKEMFNVALKMLDTCKQAFITESVEKAGEVFAQDDTVDRININALNVLTEYMKEHPEHIYDCLQISAAIRRIERIGDRCNNIAEDIIFYLDAKVLKHQGNQANSNNG